MENNKPTYSIIISKNQKIIYCGRIINDNNDTNINGFGLNVIPNNNIMSFNSIGFSVQKEINNGDYIQFQTTKDVFKTYDKIIKDNQKLQLCLHKLCKKIGLNYHTIKSKPLNECIKNNSTQYFIDNNHELYQSKDNKVIKLEWNYVYFCYYENTVSNLDIEVKELTSSDMFMFGEIQRARQTLSDMYSFFNKKFIQQII